MVTYEGKVIDKGKITFLPEDEKTAAVGVDISQGRYLAKEVPLGPKRVAILALSMAGMEPKSSAEPLIPPEATKDLKVDITQRHQQADFSLKRPDKS